MQDSLTTDMLIKHFEERIREIDRRSLGTRHGKEPHYPMLVMFLGDAFDHGLEVVTNELFLVWPQFADELCFLRLDKTQNGIAFSRAVFRGDTADCVAVPSEDVASVVSGLFSEHAHFENLNTLLLYYVLETSSLSGPDDVDAWMDAIGAAREAAGLDSLSLTEVFFVLLDESLANRDKAASIKNRVAELMKGTNTVLLSNYRSDGRILSSWDTCYNIAAATMLVSDNADAEAIAPFVNRQFLTVQYAHERKPLNSIGQVVVEKLLTELSRIAGEQQGNLLSDEEIDERLGITKEGTLKILDDYASNELIPLLPNARELEYFPRMDDIDRYDLSLLSEREFDQLTMGTWDAYLSSIVTKAQDQVRRNTALKQRWSEEYGRMLHREFTLLEVIDLGAHLDDVKRRMLAKGKRVASGGVLSAAQTRLRELISSDEQLIDLFVEALAEQASLADSYLRVFNELVLSLRRLHDVNDGKLQEFYSAKVQDYFDRNGYKLHEQFRMLGSKEELEAFLYEVIDDIIDSDSVFVAPFEEELARRYGDETHGIDARSRIKQNLMSDSVPLYLKISFNLGEPLLRAVLLKAGTSLHESLDDRREHTYFYDTGYGNAAERLVVYAVDDKILLATVGR